MHTITLVTNDGHANSLPDDVNITVIGPIKAKVNIMPSRVNRFSLARYIVTSIRLPEGITKGDIDSNEPLIMYPGNIEMMKQRILSSKAGGHQTINILAFFDKDALIDVVEQNGYVRLNVAGRLKSGQYFYGCDSVVIMGRPLQKSWWKFNQDKKSHR